MKAKRELNPQAGLGDPQSVCELVLWCEQSRCARLATQNAIKCLTQFMGCAANLALA